MRKVGILVIIALLAVTGIMAAMAYTTAEVTNEGELSVVNTNMGLLGIRAGNYAAATYDNEGRIDFDFTKGEHATGVSGTLGLQPGSVYKWNNLFFVKDNTKDDVDVEFTVDIESEEGIMEDYITVQLQHPVYNDVLFEDGNSYWFSFEGLTISILEVGVIIDVPENAELEDYSFDIILKGEDVNNDWVD